MLIEIPAGPFATSWPLVWLGGGLAGELQWFTRYALRALRSFGPQKAARIPSFPRQLLPEFEYRNRVTEGPASKRKENP